MIAVWKKNPLRINEFQQISGFAVTYMTNTEYCDRVVSSLHFL